jgi:cell division protein FtsQ
MTVAATVWRATRSSLLDVDHVRLTGATHTQPLQVIATAGTLPGLSMFGVDEGAAAARIERLPWVADATVRRRWPNTVAIDVRERRPAAVAPAVGGGWALVDARGHVLERVATPPLDRPALEGVPGVGAAGTRAPPATRATVAVAAALPVALRDRVAAVLRSPGGALQLRLRGGPTVRLGSADALGPKLVATETVLARVGAERAVLDVRDPESPVLTRR